MYLSAGSRFNRVAIVAMAACTLLLLPPISCLLVSCSAFTTTGSKFLNKNRRQLSQIFAMQVRIRTVGRNKALSSEKWLEDGYTMYEKRLKPANIAVATEWHKNNDALLKGMQADWEKGQKLVMLDPSGVSYTSEQFAEEFFRWMEQGGSRLCFAIGGGESISSFFSSVGAQLF